MNYRRVCNLYGRTIKVGKNNGKRKRCHPLINRAHDLHAFISDSYQYLSRIGGISHVLITS